MGNTADQGANMTYFSPAMVSNDRSNDTSFFIYAVHVHQLDSKASSSTSVRRITRTDILLLRDSLHSHSISAGLGWTRENDNAVYDLVYVSLFLCPGSQSSVAYLGREYTLSTCICFPLFTCHSTYACYSAVLKSTQMMLSQGWVVD